MPTNVGRIFLQAHGAWFWGVSFQLTGRKSYGDAVSLDQAKAAFKTQYEKWQGSARDEQSTGTSGKNGPATPLSDR